MGKSLFHYGVPGMKWGVRRYRSADGTKTWESIKRDRISKATKTRNDVNSIIKSMSNKDKQMLNIKQKYLSIEEGQFVVKRVLLKHGKEPVSFMDVLGDGKNLTIAIGTRSGNDYRGKGNAKKVATTGMKWVEKNKSSWDKVIWSVNKDNVPSTKLAKTTRV